MKNERANNRVLLTSDEIIIFDSTGMALQDVITAATVYKKAVAKEAGRMSISRNSDVICGD